MSKTDKRDEIVRAALELIAEQGFHGAPMAMIAERAGVGAGTIYRYFENKEKLITELYRELEGRLNSCIMEGYTTEMPVRERFLHLGTALLRYFIQNPTDFRYLEQFHNSPFGIEVRRNKFLGKHAGSDVYRELFTDGVARQVMKDLPLAVLFALAFGPPVKLARDHILGLIELDELLLVRTIEACWDGIRR